MLTSFVTFVPQCPQKGSPAATLLAHLGHVEAPPTGDVRGPAGCTSAVPDAGAGVGAGARAEVTAGTLMRSAIAAVETAGTTRAADWEIGFPQSMQKRDIGSLSRPQKAQETRGVTISEGRT